MIAGQYEYLLVNKPFAHLMLLSLILTVTQNCPSAAKIVGPSGGVCCRLSVKFEAVNTLSSKPETWRCKVFVRCAGFSIMKTLKFLIGLHFWLSGGETQVLVGSELKKPFRWGTLMDRHPNPVVPDLTLLKEFSFIYIAEVISGYFSYRVGPGLTLCNIIYSDPTFSTMRRPSF